MTYIFFFQRHSNTTLDIKVDEQYKREKQDIFVSYHVAYVSGQILKGYYITLASKSTIRFFLFLFLSNPIIPDLLSKKKIQLFQIG